MPEWQSYVEAIRAAFAELSPELREYLDTFEAESRANHAARNAAFDALPPDVQRQLIDLNREVNAQLFN